MKQGARCLELAERGYSLVEVMVALVLTCVIMASVYGMLRRGQESAMREPEISALQQSARGGLSMLDRDLTLAGFKTPGAMAVSWHDGGGAVPDEITIVYADPEVPTAETRVCRRGLPCELIHQSSVLNLNPGSLAPKQEDPETAYSTDVLLLAVESSDCNHDEKIGIYPFRVTREPRLGRNGGLSALLVDHEPVPLSEVWQLTDNFNNELHPDCTIIGGFHLVQYRVHPMPPDPHPNLERRDLSLGEEWMPVAANIENLQFTYATGSSKDFMDSPPYPIPIDPMTWVTRVKVTVAGRSESANLRGSSKGRFFNDDAHVRKSFSTTVSLRNLVAQVQEQTKSRIYN